MDERTREVRGERRRQEMMPACGGNLAKQVPYNARHVASATAGGAVTRRLTVQDVAQSLGAEQVLQSRHFVLQVSYQLVVGVLVDDSVTLDVFSPVSVTAGGREEQVWSNSHGIR